LYLHEASNPVECSIANELLWSEYSNAETGVSENKNNDIFNANRITYRFGDMKVKKFIYDNNLIMIIRSHECI